MEVSASTIKELRERTGAGILDCKKALVENNGDVEAAATFLREKGLAKAVKKASRISAEGVFNVHVEGNKAVVYEVNCETDFVAKNEKFNNYVNELGNVLFESGVTNTEEALAYTKADGQTIQEMVLGIIAVIGENITLRNVQVITKTDSQVFGLYRHNGGKIAVVTVLEGGDEAVGKNLSMHICANNPQYLDAQSVDPEFVAKEREVLLTTAMNENAALANPKPENIVAKMVEGRLNKELKETCLVEQPYLIDPSTTVKDFLKAKGIKVVSFKRFEVGVGVEKKANDFVNEVMSQMGAK